MTPLMELIYDYASNGLLPRYLDHEAYDEAARMGEKLFAALKDSLSPEQLAMLEKYQENRDQSRALELQAMFLAAFSAAQELS